MGQLNNNHDKLIRLKSCTLLPSCCRCRHSALTVHRLSARGRDFDSVPWSDLI